MASVTSSTIPFKCNQFVNTQQRFIIRSTSRNQALLIKNVALFNFGISHQQGSLYPCYPHQGGSRHVLKPVSAVDSGLEASIDDVSGIVLKKAKVVVDSQDEDKMEVSVEITPEETQKVFGVVLRNLARTAPPIPGFRRDKGGKTTNVPTDFLLQILGEERVTKFVIQEIVTTSLADFVKKENLTIKENKGTTSQTVEELQKLFTPGKEFAFNATLEFERPVPETDDDSADLTDVEVTDVEATVVEVTDVEATVNA